MGELVQYNCRLDSDKKKLAMKMGLNLNAIFRNALDVALKIETNQTLDLMKEKELVELELKKLDEDKKNYLNDYNNNKLKLENKLKQIKNSLDNIVVEKEKKSEMENYNKLVNMVFNRTNFDDIQDLLSDHAERYNIDIEDLRRNIERDVTYKKFK